MRRDVFVFADWDGLGGPASMGVLRADIVRGKEVFSFDYDRGWLVSNPPPDLDPELRLYPGPQYPGGGGRANFALFLDSAPDRWGRTIMRRREAALARKEKREAKRLLESDFLLGVHDEQRLGGLRFKLEENGRFLDDRGEMAIPPWTSLRELEGVAWKLQDENLRDDDDAALAWLELLLAPGSSLGGARPKAGVRAPDGDLWIAKFPGRGDEHDVGGRDDLGRRVHFASALTLLGSADGAGFEDGTSYLALVEFLCNRGAEAGRDLEELWRRVVFSIGVSNTDDHLRNHGFLLTPEGWRLAPAYDLNPTPYGRGLSLNINESDNALSFGLALEVAPHFRLKAPDAERILGQVRDAVSRWDAVARAAGLPPAERERLSGAFRLA